MVALLAGLLLVGLELRELHLHKLVAVCQLIEPLQEVTRAPRIDRGHGSMTEGGCRERTDCGAFSAILTRATSSFLLFAVVVKAESVGRWMQRLQKSETRSVACV